MKTLKFVVLPLLIAFLFGCKAEPLEGDEDAPIIEILSPTDNAILYVQGSQSNPTTLQIQAKATDNNAVVLGVLTIENSEGNLVDADYKNSNRKRFTVIINIILTLLLIRR